MLNPSTAIISDIYPHQVRFNSRTDPTFLAFALSSGDVAIISYPSLDLVYKINVDTDIYGLDFSPSENSNTVWRFCSVLTGRSL